MLITPNNSSHRKMPLPITIQLYICVFAPMTIGAPYYHYARKELVSEYGVYIYMLEGLISVYLISFFIYFARKYRTGNPSLGIVPIVHINEKAQDSEDRDKKNDTL